MTRSWDWKSMLPRHLSLPSITVTAALASVGLRLYNQSHGIASNGIFTVVSSFSLFWIGSFTLSCLYFVFVYPFYISPLRNLPTPPNAHWLLGHMPYMIKATPGTPSRKW